MFVIINRIEFVIKMNKLFLRRGNLYHGYKNLKTILLLIIPVFFIQTIVSNTIFAQDTIKTDNKIIRIAVRAHSGKDAAIQRWSATAKYLSNSVNGFTFQILPLVTFDEMRNVVENNEVEFVLTNPTAYIDLSVKYGIARIATLINGRGERNYSKSGAVIFVEADRDDINLLRDVKGKSIMGVHKEAFGGWQMAYGELLAIGINPFTVCSEVLFSPNGTQEEVVNEVLQGKVDVGTVRTGILENMAKKGKINLQNIKIIEAKSDEFQLPHTTMLYPEWPFATLKNTDKILAKEVAIALFQLKKNNLAAVTGNYSGWKVPLSYHEVLTLLKLLKVSPFEDYGEISFKKIILRYRYWFVLGFLFILFLTITIFYIRWLNKKLKKSQTIIGIRVEERTSELRMSNRKLEKQHHLLERAEEIGKTGTWELDLLENKLFLTDNAHEIWGISQRTIPTYEMVFNYIYPDDKEYVRTQWMQALKGKKFDIEHRILVNGEIKWLKEKGEIMFDKNNLPISAIVFTQDITEHKLTEEALRGSEEKFRTLIENISDFIFIIDSDFRIFSLNKAATNFIDNKAGNIIGKYLSDIFPVDIAKTYEKGLLTVFETGKPVTKDSVIKLAGFESFISTSLSPILGEKGKVTAVIGISRDVTERKQEKEEFLLSKARYQSLFNDSPVPLWEEDFSLLFAHLEKLRKKGVTNLSNYLDRNPEELSIFAKKVKIIDVNKAALKLHNARNKEELLGNLDKIFTKKSFDVFKEEILALDQGLLEFETEGETKTLNGEVKQVFVKLKIDNNKHDSLRVLLATFDITERIQAEETLRQSEEDYRLLFENAGVGIGISDISGKILTMNKSMVRITGYTFEEISKINIKDTHVNIKDRNLIPNIIKKDGKAENIEIQLRKKNGEIYWASLSVNPIVYAGEKVLLTTALDITERKQVEKALFESENKMSSIFRIAPTGIGLVMDRVIYDVNPRICDMVGYQKEELIGKNARILYPFQEDFESVGKEKYRQIAEHGTGVVETRWQKKDGVIIQILLSSTPIDINDYTKGIIFTALDITKRKQAEEALRESEEWFSAITKQSVEGITVASHQGKYVFVNPAFCKMVGYSKEELLKMSVFDMKKNKGKEGKKGFIKSKSNKNGEIIEVELQRRDKSTFMAEIIGKPIKIANNELVLGIVNDITERKKAEERISHFNRIFEGSLNEIYLFDAHNWKFTQVNSAAQRNLGYNIDELQKLSPLDLKPEFTDDSYAKLLNPLKTGEKQKVVFETVHKRKDQSLYNVEVHIELLKYEHKTLFAAIILDITGRKKNEEELRKYRENLEKQVKNRTIELEKQTESLKKSQNAMMHLLEEVNLAREELEKTNTDLHQANSDLESFSYSVSHDLKAPLRAIDGFSKILLSQYNNLFNHEGKELVHLIFENVSQMRLLIDDLLQFSRIQREKIVYSDINIEEIFKKVYKELSRNFDNNKFSFNVNKLPQCSGNSRLIERVVTNILSNAIKYSGNNKKSTIEVSAEIKNDMVIYLVKDNGIGFDMKYKDKLFVVFHRLHTSAKYKGTGIGLALVKRIITKHGGKVWAQSEPGKGATFYFSLPKAIEY